MVFVWRLRFSPSASRGSATLGVPFELNRIFDWQCQGAELPTRNELFGNLSSCCGCDSVNFEVFDPYDDARRHQLLQFGVDVALNSRNR